MKLKADRWICFLIFFVEFVVTKDLKTEFMTDETQWLPWQDCDDHGKCYSKRMNKCSNSSKPLNGSCGWQYNEIYQQVVIGCHSCPSGGWVEERGWSLCESKDCKSTSKTRLFVCKDYRSCHLEETGFCVQYKTCNGTYENWTMIKNCSSCHGDDSKTFQRKWVYDGQASSLCGENDISEHLKLTKSVICKPSDCKVEAVWDAWGDCRCEDEMLKPLKTRRCLYNCKKKVMEKVECEGSCELSRTSRSTSTERAKDEKIVTTKQTTEQTSTKTSEKTSTKTSEKTSTKTTKTKPTKSEKSRSDEDNIDHSLCPKNKCVMTAVIAAIITAITETFTCCLLLAFYKRKKKKMKKDGLEMNHLSRNREASIS